MADARETHRRPQGPVSFFKDVRCEDAVSLQLPDETAASWPPPERIGPDPLRRRCAEANPGRWRTLMSSSETA